MVLPRSALRTLLSAQSKRVPARSARLSRHWQQAGRRGYASEAAHPKAGSDMPWLIGSIAFTAPAAYYLYQSAPPKEAHYGHGHGPTGHDEHTSDQPHVKTHAAEPEEADKKLTQADLHAEQTQETETPRAPEDKSAPPTTETDEARENKEVGGWASMSGKQKGLEDADTKNPRLDEKKAEEGGIESARAKGTVKTGETLNTDKERSPEK